MQIMSTKSANFSCRDVKILIFNCTILCMNEIIISYNIPFSFHQFLMSSRNAVVSMMTCITQENSYDW